jgi:uncharacterized membrane protein
MHHPDLLCPLREIALIDAQLINAQQLHFAFFLSDPFE